MKRFGKRLMALAVIVGIVAVAVGIAAGYTNYPPPPDVPVAIRYGFAGGFFGALIGFGVGLVVWLTGVVAER